MKVLLINGSPHERGCTFLALREVAGALQKEGVETELLYLGAAPVPDCLACESCAVTGRCVFDDAVNDVTAKLDEYDGIVVGSPVYFAGPTGAVCSFLDRLFYHFKPRMAGKVGAAVVCCRRGGASAALDRLNKYFSISNMQIAGSQYWNILHAEDPGDVPEDAEGMQTLRTLGQNMAWMLKSVAAGRRDGLAKPAYEKRVKTNFVRR